MGKTAPAKNQSVDHIKEFEADIYLSAHKENLQTIHRC